MAPRKSGSLCCVVGCVNNRLNSPGTHFYGFPTKAHFKDQRLRWLAAVNRVNPDGSPWQPSRTSSICSKHFIDNKKSMHPQSPSYVPSIFPEAYKRPNRSAKSMGSAKKSIRRKKLEKAREEKEKEENQKDKESPLVLDGYPEENDIVIVKHEILDIPECLDVSTPTPFVSRSEAMDAIDVVRRFICQQEHASENAFQLLNQLEKML